MQDNRPRNENGQRHGLWKVHWNEHDVIANFVNDELYGYVEARSETILDKSYLAR